MKVCIPTAGKGGIDDHVGQHFGRAPTYTIVDTDTSEVEVIQNTGEHMGGTGLPPEFISKTGTHIMLCGGLGPRAIMMFEQFGIDVFVGAEGKVSDVVEAWKQGMLVEATDENACREHRHG
ncbi:MAG TPA: dinitrogenase iron-molybdenum cofactor biosynthesis protein [Methanosarcinales archaeon]|nr:dinitrogenase iron-molybdenum cofactor biosynthesis protein [Methanosarcinales archaeon]